MKAATESWVLMVAILIGVMSILSLIPLIGSGCLPAYIIAAIAFYLITFLIRFLWDAIAANAGVSSIVDLYSRAEMVLTVLVADQPQHPEATRIQAQKKVLKKLRTAAGEDLAKLFGFVVDCSVLGGFLVTGLTVGVGLFGILRGAGARVIIQTVCPI
jgi:hypothetical protein